MGWEREGRFPGPKVTSCNFLYRLCNEGDWGGEGRMGGNLLIFNLPNKE